MNRIMMVMMVLVVSMALKPDLSLREKQLVSECTAARYDIALLSAKVPERPVVAGEAVTLVDLARALSRITGVLETAAEEMKEVQQQMVGQRRELAGLRRQVTEMAAAAVVTANNQSWFDWLSLFAVGRQQFLAFIACVGGWEVSSGWHRLKWLCFAFLCQPFVTAVWLVMVISVWAGRKGWDPSGIAAACCLGGCPLWRRGSPAADLLDLDEPAELGVGPVGAAFAAMLYGHSAVVATVEAAVTVAAAATVVAGAAAAVATAVVAVPAAVATVVQPRSMYRYIRVRRKNDCPPATIIAALT